MRIGIASAQIGRMADPAAVRATALAAEQVGYHSLWVLDRLPAPIHARSGYGGIAGIPLPTGRDRALDPFVVLATAAAVTTTVRLGTSVIVAPWYPPVILARLLLSLDIVSEGRLAVGLGTGWSLDEYEAAGADMRRRGRDLDEILDVLEAHWSEGPIAHDGRLARIAPAKNLLRPVQRPRPRLYLAAYSPAAMERVAQRADGWMPAGLPVEAIAPMWAQVRDMAAGFGRDPDAMELIVRVNFELTKTPVPVSERLPYYGSLEQVIDDVEATRVAGADEVILHLGGDPSLDETLEACAGIAEAIGIRPAA